MTLPVAPIINQGNKMTFQNPNAAPLPFKPNSGAHSVKEASAAIFVSSEITPIREFISLSQDVKEINELYPQYQLIIKTESTFDSVSEEESSKQKQDESSTPLTTDLEAGFALAFVNENSVATKIFQGVNEGEGRVFFSYHDMEYVRWINFKERLSKTLCLFQEQLSKYTPEAIGLTYIDEYLWEKESKIDYNKIFSKETDQLPKSFFQEGNTDSEITTTSNFKKNGYSFFVRLHINPTYSEDSNVLRITHNAVYIDDNISLENLESQDKNSVLDILQASHELNKDILKSILNKETIDLIKLT
ncbi:TIGR04255 family protein [Hymenobacter guriensis]|uniref:TIGR04255 family protein n=1 Tax=Hymenobacter guriensis TaxID=2793065 RepID=A0ABS0L4G9_9BACT|nr:TIGR04255 family protein [Hymenobacter guriensis]MBG8555040.1 TIGR04255 family protein [Hymenobacter guriensis]